MEDQQQHVQDEYFVGSYTLFDILQAAPRLADFLPPQGCKGVAAACTRMRTWHRTRVTVIRLTDPKHMAWLQPQHWPRLVTVMLDSTSDHRVSEVDRIDVKRRLPATWTKRASMYLGAGYPNWGQAPMRISPPIDTTAILVQPAGLQMLQHQDKRPHMCSLKNLIRQAASYVKDMVIAGDLDAPITEMPSIGGQVSHTSRCLDQVH